MTVTAPPRPPRRPSDPVTHGEFDALVEALIEEARQRGRRRHRRNVAIVILVALVGVTLFALLGGGAQSQTASPALSARSSLSAAAPGSKIAFISEGPPGSGGYCGVVYVMNSDGSGQRRLNTGWAAPRDPHSCAQEGDPAWSPDGRQIAIAGSPDVGNWGIYVMNADGSKLRKLTNGVGYENGASWSPDGRKIAFTTWRDDTVALAIVNADGSAQRMLTRNLAGTLAPAWSPDGRKIAFVTQRDGSRVISVINADGSGQRMLTPITGRNNVPVWSPNGRKIAFVSNWQIWVMNADGSAQRRLTHNGVRNVAPAWSPDGQRITFERRLGREKTGSCSGCGRASIFQVWSMNANGSEPRMLARQATHPVWSPDGRKIAFQYPVGPRGPGGLGKQTDIYVMNADGTGKRNLTRTPRNESAPVWSPAQR